MSENKLNPEANIGIPKETDTQEGQSQLSIDISDLNMQDYMDKGKGKWKELAQAIAPKMLVHLEQFKDMESWEEALDEEFDKLTDEFLGADGTSMDQYDGNEFYEELLKQMLWLRNSR